MTGDSAPFRLAQLEALEETHDVFDKTVDGIAPWELARWEVASTLRRELTDAGAAHDTPEGVAAMLQAGTLALTKLLRRNPYRAVPADICIVGHPRRKLGLTVASGTSIVISCSQTVCWTWPASSLATSLHIGGFRRHRTWDNWT